MQVGIFMQNVAPYPQTIAVPGHSGVNIQIFNPSVMAPGAQPPVYNVNSPNYGTYPPEYYTNQYGGGANNAGENNSGEVVKSFQANTTNTTNNKKTEKRKIVELTDDYIKNLENYLNSQDKEIRLMGAREVVDRLTEDDARADDRALNALVNKMIQDPAAQIRVLGLSMLDARLAKGDDTTVRILKNIQGSTEAYGMDAVTAANVLLKMSGKQVEKEFEVKPQKETKS
jgi:hypothetical protein